MELLPIHLEECPGKSVWSFDLLVDAGVFVKNAAQKSQLIRLLLCLWSASSTAKGSSRGFRCRGSIVSVVFSDTVRSTATNAVIIFVRLSGDLGKTPSFVICVEHAPHRLSGAVNPLGVLRVYSVFPQVKRLAMIPSFS